MIENSNLLRKKCNFSLQCFAKVKYAKENVDTRSVPWPCPSTLRKVSLINFLEVISFNISI